MKDHRAKNNHDTSEEEQGGKTCPTKYEDLLGHNNNTVWYSLRMDKLTNRIERLETVPHRNGT